MWEDGAGLSLFHNLRHTTNVSQNRQCVYLYPFVEQFTQHKQKVLSASMYLNHFSTCENSDEDLVIVAQPRFRLTCCICLHLWSWTWFTISVSTSACHLSQSLLFPSRRPLQRRLFLHSKKDTRQEESQTQTQTKATQLGKCAPCGKYWKRHHRVEQYNCTIQWTVSYECLWQRQFEEEPQQPHERKRTCIP